MGSKFNSNGLYCGKVTAVQALPQPVGLAYAMRVVYDFCELCHTTHKRKNLKVDINLKILDNDKFIKRSHRICYICYLRTQKKLNDMKENKDNWPLYINDDNIFIQHYIKKQ